MRKTGIFIIAMSLIASSVFAAGQGEGNTAKYPEKTIEFVVPASPGGGSDILARLILDIIQKNKLVDGNIVVVNKGGGGGAVGMAYLASQPGDYAIITMNAAQALAIRTTPGLSSTEFSYLANLAMDNVLFVAKAGGPFKTFKDAVDAIKQNPESISVGVADNLDKLCVVQINEEAGTKFNTVYFNSAGEIATALLGGHVQLGIFNPNECIGQVQAGTMVPLAAFSKKRLDAPFQNAPTFIELGFPGIEFQMFRSIMGAPKMSPQVQQYWSDVMKKVVETDQWKTNYVKKNGLEENFMPSAEYGPYHTKTTERLFTMGKAIGMFQ